MKGYKALHEGLTAIHGFQYEIGKEYTIDGELEICENGFHFCMNVVDVFGYYGFSKKETVVCEVEASGKIIQEGTKFCAEKIKLVRILEWKEIENVINADDTTGEHNSGHYNTGMFNSGHHNSGDFNSGNRNTGHHNSRNFNSGNHNSGAGNTGDCNSGNRNTGHHNSGDFNNGNYNTGNWNSGGYNTGSYNSGYYNTGNWNTGNWNSGSKNSGFFNSNEPNIRLFNKDSGMTYEEFYMLGIDLQDLEWCKEKIKALPNYDAQIFYDCTGIDWREEE